MSNVRWFSALWPKFTSVSKCRVKMRAAPHGAATARERYLRKTGLYSRNRVLSVAALAASALWCAGCSNKTPTKETVEEAPTAPKLLPAVNMGDPKAEKQLLSGFYAIEANAWRWTGKDFSVALRPPVGSAAQGATLDFELSVPQAAIDKLHNVTLSATVNGTALAPETYSHQGEASYKRELAPNLLAGDLVRVDFHLDKAIPPANGDMRQLGIVARNVALEAKSTSAK